MLLLQRWPLTGCVVRTYPLGFLANSVTTEDDIRLFEQDVSRSSNASKYLSRGYAELRCCCARDKFLARTT